MPRPPIALLAVLVLCACGKDKYSLAELKQASGVVERQEGSGAKQPAALGAKFFVSDAAFTSEGNAELAVIGGATIAMQDHTIVRFGGTPPSAIQISVESGAIDLSGTGQYSLGVGGKVHMPDTGGTVRITAGGGGATVELRVGGGGGQVIRNNETFALVVNKPVSISDKPIDAGVPPPVDAAVAAVADAGSEPAKVATIEVHGPDARLLAPGATKPVPLPQGSGPLAPGSTVLLGKASTAKITDGDVTLDMLPNAHAKLDDNLGLTLDTGTANAIAKGPASIALPGGAVALTGDAGTPGKVKLTGTGKQTAVKAESGGTQLTGRDSSLDMHLGDTATLTGDGAIHQDDVSPSYFDFRVHAGERFTIHDPKAESAVQLLFDGKCPGEGVIEIDRDRTLRVTAGHDFATVKIRPGTVGYRLRCNSIEGPIVASGLITLKRDDGRRPLPVNQRVNDIEADGRNWTISYQSAIPSLAVHVRNPGALQRLHLAAAGKEQTFDSPSSTITVPGSQLRETTYTFWVDRDGVRQDKVQTLKIDFDQTAPQVYIESPTNGQPWGSDIQVSGAVLAGWSAAVEGITLPFDNRQRFKATVDIPPGKALAIRLSHPSLGIHYYLRRPQ